MYEITYSNAVAKDLKAIEAPKRSQILDQIEVQLTHEPSKETRNRKILVGLVPPWERAACLGVEDRGIPSFLRY